jgi:RNA polymerase sigma factor (sigma-70 family)
MRAKILTTKRENFIFGLLMPQQTTASHEQDLSFAQSVLNANSAAAAELRGRYHGRLVAVLCARGASATEAEDLVADLWSDCFAAPPNRPTLLGKYQGRCALESWLMTVATHRLIDLKRRQNFRVEVPVSDRSSDDFFDRRPQPESVPREEALLKLLRAAIRSAFSKRDSESVLMLKLVHVHQLTQREIARMWGWHESKVSRALEGARESIARDILLELKRADPWLDLRWEDFLELCSGSSDALF